MRLWIVLMFSIIMTSPAAAKTQLAFFAGGCFWCTESDFEQLPGVLDVVSGYMGGTEIAPSYKDVAAGRTGHRETVRVLYDDTKTSYQKLLSAFWRMHDPSDAGGSFVDRGKQYSSAIYYVTPEQKQLAQGAITALNQTKKFSRPIATIIAPAGTFYRAEAYHQDYAKKQSFRYKYYRQRSGRDQFIAQFWAKDMQLYQLTNNRNNAQNTGTP